MDNTMDKDEILEKAREESKGHVDEREMDIRLKATRTSYAVGLLVAAIIMVLETAFLDGPTLPADIMWSSMFGIDATMVGWRLKHRVTLWCGITMLACAIVFLALYIISLATQGA